MTFTLDDDVGTELKRLRRSEGKRFNAIVNDALRRGLQQSRPYRTRSVSLGRPNLANADNVTDALVFAEGEEFK